ncbi:MAG: hypothetical protein AAGF01_04955 [Cyanobacteria bacterium P01_G01_bin.38]
MISTRWSHERNAVFIALLWRGFFYTMLEPEGTRNPMIECILALENAGIPEGTKIPEASMLLAFVRAMKRRGEAKITGEEISVPDIFIAELKEILADPKPTLMPEIISTTQSSVDDLQEQSSEAGTAMPAEMIALSLGLGMLLKKQKKDSHEN